MRSLQARMFIVFAVIATVPLLALSYLSLAQTRAAALDQVGADHEQTANAAAGLVQAYLDTARSQLQGEAARLAIAPPNDTAGWTRAIEAAQARATAFSALWVLDAQGALVAGNVSTRAPLVVDVPIDGAHRLEGVLTTASLGHSLERLSRGGERVFIIDAAGKLVATPDPSVAIEPALARAAASSPVGHNTLSSNDGTLLAAYARLPEQGWIVVDTVPTAQALAPLARVTAVVVVLSGVLMGGILLASVLVARRIVAPVRELTEAAAELSAGNLSRRIDARGDDEIAELGRTFNQMAERIAESLEGLRRSETRYRGLVESANDIIFTLQPDETVAFLSPLAKRLFGPHVGQGSPTHELVHEGDRQAFRDAVARVFERGEPALFVPFRVLASDRSARVVLANFTPVFEQDERPARVLAVLRDVTEERRQEVYREKSFLMARLVSEERDLDKLAARGLSILTAMVGARGGAVMLARAGELRDVATVGEALPRAVARRAFDEAGPVHDVQKGRAILALPLIEQGEVLGVVGLIGEPRAVDDAEPAEVLSSLAAQLAVGLRRSLFEARLKEYAAELETRVAARTAELTAKSQEMESFLYSVSHDLKAPLISIQGYAQGLEEDYAAALAGDGKLFLERIRKNASLMESLILDILELSRIGRVREQVERVDMDGVLSEVAARVNDRLRSQGGKLTIQQHLPAVHGERKRLEQLFANLVDNAIKYRHPARPPEVSVHAHLEGAEAVLTVRDNGRGVPPRLHEQLFKIFTRVPMPGLPDPGGTGMGLAIVKRIVETHGGRIWVESHDEGTTFHVALPWEA